MVPGRHPSRGITTTLLESGRPILLQSHRVAAPPASIGRRFRTEVGARRAPSRLLLRRSDSGALRCVPGRRPAGRFGHERRPVGQHPILIVQIDSLCAIAPTGTGYLENFCPVVPCGSLWLGSGFRQAPRHVRLPRRETGRLPDWPIARLERAWAATLRISVGSGC